MNDEEINRLTDVLSDLLNSILNERNLQADFRLPQHVGMYLNQFMIAVDQNSGNPVPYDRFSESLFRKIPSDRPLYEQIITDFRSIWSGWVELYNHLRNEGRLS